ncbi:MAG: arylsulfotransferase family protein [Candidatus Altiarchaeota archaeon]|nr:arylsulfotransferase family protein [Candidatus Altiarchaeota archaeon]
MFNKKTLFIASAILICSAVLFLGLSNQKVDDGDTGRAKEETVISRLAYLGYLDYAVDDRYTDRGGVTVYVRDKTWEGLNLFILRGTNKAVLMLNNGTVAYQWNTPENSSWGHIHLLPGQKIAAMSSKAESIAVFDKNSEKVYETYGPYHHDIYFTGDGFITIRNHMVEKMRHTIVDNEFVFFNDIFIEQYNISIFDLLVDSGEFDAEDIFSADTADIRNRGESTVVDLMNDFLHTNSIDMYQQDSTLFNEGDILSCVRNLDLIFVFDPGTRRIKWMWGQGILDRPHTPRILENGNILVFDNGMHRNYSRVVEVDPVTDEIVWEYLSDPPEAFHTTTMGSAQRLPNGNTLIVESNRGRVFEVTKDKELVWEYITKKNAEGQQRTIYRMEKVSI